MKEIGEREREIKEIGKEKVIVEMGVSERNRIEHLL